MTAPVGRALRAREHEPRVDVVVGAQRRACSTTTPTPPDSSRPWTRKATRISRRALELLPPGPPGGRARLAALALPAALLARRRPARGQPRGEARAASGPKARKKCDGDAVGASSGGVGERQRGVLAGGARSPSRAAATCSRRTWSAGSRRRSSSKAPSPHVVGCDGIVDRPERVVGHAEDDREAALRRRARAAARRAGTKSRQVRAAPRSRSPAPPSGASASAARTASVPAAVARSASQRLARRGSSRAGLARARRRERRRAARARRRRPAARRPRRRRARRRGRPTPTPRGPAARRARSAARARARSAGGGLAGMRARATPTWPGSVPSAAAVPDAQPRRPRPTPCRPPGGACAWRSSASRRTSAPARWTSTAARVETRFVEFRAGRDAGPHARRARRASRRTSSSSSVPRSSRRARSPTCARRSSASSPSRSRARVGDGRRALGPRGAAARLRGLDRDNVDRIVSFDPLIVPTADEFMPVWRSLPIPVADRLYRPVRRIAGHAADALRRPLDRCTASAGCSTSSTASTACTSRSASSVEELERAARHPPHHLQPPQRALPDVREPRAAAPRRRPPRHHRAAEPDPRPRARPRLRRGRRPRGAHARRRDGARVPRRLHARPRARPPEGRAVPRLARVARLFGDLSATCARAGRTGRPRGRWVASKRRRRRCDAPRAPKTAHRGRGMRMSVWALCSHAPTALSAPSRACERLRRSDATGPSARPLPPEQLARPRRQRAQPAHRRAHALHARRSSTASCHAFWRASR